MAQAASSGQEERGEIYQKFRDLVNMTPKQLEKWLQTEESKKVGFRHEGEQEAVGHGSGRKIIQILEQKKADLSDDDYAHMKKVISYIKRHSAQRPDGDIEDTRWRFSLMNWGHDPKQSQ